MWTNIMSPQGQEKCRWTCILHEKEKGKRFSNCFKSIHKISFIKRYFTREMVKHNPRNIFLLQKQDAIRKHPKSGSIPLYDWITKPFFPLKSIHKPFNWKGTQDTEATPEKPPSSLISQLTYLGLRVKQTLHQIELFGLVVSFAGTKTFDYIKFKVPFSYLFPPPS